MTDNTERSSVNLIIGAVLIGLGLLFLLVQLPGVQLGRYMWPFFIIVPGLAFFVAMVVAGRNAGPLAIPGSIVTTVGLILLVQNATDHWESWAYTWALIPTAAGVGMIISGMWSFRPDLVTQGRRTAGIGLVMFLAFTAFFELLIFGGYIGYMQWLWPVLLIVLGLFLLLRRSRAF